MAEPIGFHVPLTATWELVLMEDGSLCVACNHEEDRYVLEVGHFTLSKPEDLAEGINMLRSQGTSWNKPN
jgi:hypothetical protein